MKFSIILLLLLLLSSCGTAPVKEDSSGTEGVFTISLEEVTARLDAADREDGPTRANTYLNVTQALIEAEEIDWARNTLAQLAPYFVPADQSIRYAVLAATLAVAQGQFFRAKAYLWDERVGTIAAQSPVSERVKLHEIRARLLYGLGEYHASIAERLSLENLFIQDTDDRLANNNALWQTLMEMPFAELKLESQIQNDMLAKGWYTLAALSKNNQTNLSQQLAEVEAWRINWPEHPASLQLPADLRLLEQLDQDKPMQIAILLPFSGRFSIAAEAIRDGIMAAYYDAATQTDQLPDLRLYDSAGDNINSIYDEAVLQGAQLIIGPLEQGKILDLALRLDLSVPTIALNRITQSVDIPRGLFQFGLALEDEAEQVATQAWQDGYRRAMVLAPATANGNRSVESFGKQWLELGGNLTSDYRYQAQSAYSSLIKTALKIDQSELRRREIRQLIGKRVEFEPRRRKDIDFIFLYSHASQAQQLKPTLAFHYAGDIPVYALRNIYNGEQDKKRDKDLNGIRFTTLPWFFDESLPEKRAIQHNIRSSNYQFLYALGVDAYHIHPRLRQLKEVKQANFYGATGKLSLDQQQRIHREQMWAIFSRGAAVPVTSFSANDAL